MLSIRKRSLKVIFSTLGHNKHFMARLFSKKKQKTFSQKYLDFLKKNVYMINIQSYTIRIRTKFVADFGTVSTELSIFLY